MPEIHRVYLSVPVKLCSYGTDIFLCTEISPINKRERKITFHTIFVRGEFSLVNLSKCLLANRDNFSPHEQALNQDVTQMHNINSTQYINITHVKPGKD